MTRPKVPPDLTPEQPHWFRPHDLYGPGPAGPTPPSFVVRHREGYSYPRVACAGCGELITDVRMAGVVWHPRTMREDDVSPIFALCKTNHCLARDPRWKHWPWEELDCYLIGLLENTGGHPAKKFRQLVADADRFAEYSG
jgi:hypothetical protein